jgi:hypothetical protein
LKSVFGDVASEIASALGSVFDETTSEIESALSSFFSWSEIQAIGGAFESFVPWSLQPRPSVTTWTWPTGKGSDQRGASPPVGPPAQVERPARPNTAAITPGDDLSPFDGPERPHLQHPEPGHGVLGGHFQSLVQVAAFQDVKTGDLFLGLSERPVCNK